MKKYIIPFILSICSITAFTQQPTYNISGITTKKITTLENPGITIDIGKKITLQNFLVDPNFSNCYIVKLADSQVRISISDLKKINFNVPSSKEELWQIIRINSDLDQSLLSKGFQYDMRKDLEDESIEAFQNFEKYYGFFDDEYLEDYIQSLLYRIHPITLNDLRPGNLAVKILKTSFPNAFCMPTGTIILTTGLLSTIRSEDELIGVLAHEVAHFVLDHQVVNINKAITRQKQAEFWAGFATSIAAASEIYLSAKTNYIPTGSITLATAILSTSIANSISERIGTNYSIEQELEADNAAVMTLSFLHKDARALSAALSRIIDFCTLNGDYLALSASGTHPSLSSRIMKMGYVDPNIFNNTRYDRLISFVNTFNSINEYGLRHLEATLELTNRNIESGIGTEDDYLLKAMAIRLLFDTPEKNQEALTLITKAKVLNVAPHAYIFKEEAITLLRLGKQKEAIEALNMYLKNLESDESTDALINEIEWVKKMIYKISVFTN